MHSNGPNGTNSRYFPRGSLRRPFGSSLCAPPRTNQATGIGSASRSARGAASGTHQWTAPAKPPRVLDRIRIRHGPRRRFLSFEDANVIEPHAEGGANAIDGAQRMSRALATISPDAREAIVLFELEGLTLEEIAELHRLPRPGGRERHRFFRLGG